MRSIIFVHGLVKFQGGIKNIVGWFESNALLGFLAYGVSLLEIVGGVALIIGFATRIVSVVYALLMIGAILKVNLSVGLLGNGQMAGYELDLAFLAIAVYLAITDSKFLSINQLFSQKESDNLKKAA
ncbi:DoxX family protein [Lysinibacillus antri]|uniref:DoxX family protein n=1 Tax=Lysinibacillus antri TaxID=2498145 RepID=UPI00319E2163